MQALITRLRATHPIPLVLWDIVAFTLAVIVAWATRTEIGPITVPTGALTLVVGVAAGVFFATGFTLGLYRNRWMMASFAEVSWLTVAWICSVVASTVVNLFLPERVSMSLLALMSIASLLLLFAGRACWRLINNLLSRPDPLGRKRLAVYGAGDAGHALIRSVRNDRGGAYVPVAVFDDDASLRNRVVEGIRVAGGVDAIRDMGNAADVLIIARSDLEPDQIAEISAAARDARLEVLVMPAPGEMLGLLGTARDARPIAIADLLGRPEVDIDDQAVVDYIGGARVLITGAGGSIGSELSRQIAALGPAKLYMLDRDETGLQQVQIEIFGHGLLNDPGLILANIRDRDRVFEIFEKIRPEVVMHAAALKHLPLLESHPREGLLTNVDGSQNVIDAAVEYNVRHFINVSTDKAAEPTSVLGSTKRLAEALTIDAAGRTEGTFVSVRFGNVLGSRGSVLPTFERQLAAGGPLTVTHPDVTRYFMSIPEAARLILQAGAIGRDGETMVLDMGEPVKIVELAKRLIEHRGSAAEITFTGLRPNEKLHEDLLAGTEEARPGPHPRITHIAPSMHAPSADVLAALHGPAPDLAADLLRVAESVSRSADVTPLHRRGRAPQ